jgi:phenylacetic acid degradation operon negative regulatory protein
VFDEVSVRHSAPGSRYESSPQDRVFRYHELVSQPKARALIFDLLGDYVRFSGGEIRLKALVALGEQLGISSPTMRVTVARMRQENWLEVRREGRESIYSLTVKCLRLLDEGRQRIFRDEPPPWSGEWSMVIYTVPESDRPTREQLRRDLAWLGFGSLAPATWVSPHPLLDRVAEIGAALPNARLELVKMRASDIAADRSIAARCWDLAALNTEYAAFIREVRLQLPNYRSGRLDGAESLVARIELLHSYRHFPYRDPGLPADLQPAGWLGEQARVLFNEAHELLAPTAQAHYESIVRATMGEEADDQTASSTSRRAS